MEFWEWRFQPWPPTTFCDTGLVYVCQRPFAPNVYHPMLLAILHRTNRDYFFKTVGFAKQAAFAKFS